MAIVSFENVTMSYEGKKVINNLNFNIEQGDYICIVGENGSGKTTLLKGLLSLKKVDSGKIVFGEDLKKTEIGYLPQQTDFQKDFPAGVKEVVYSGCLNKNAFNPFYSKKNKQLAIDAMKKLDISNLASKCYHELSGGQQQRVLLARAICASKRLLVLDEPVTGLDMGVAGEMYQIIKKLNEEGMTVLMISHDIEKACRYAGKILHIGDNKVLFFGTAEDYAEKIASGGLWE